MLTVIINTDESERVLVRTLACLVPGATAGLISEVVLADAGSKDETAEIGDIAGCRLLQLPGPLATRLRQAAASIRGPWLMFLRPGTVLDSSWVVEVERFIDEGLRAGELGAATFRPAPGGVHSSMLAEAFALLLAAFLRRKGPDQGLVLPKRLYDEIGGHRTGVADPETDLLRRLGRRVVRLSAAAGMPR